jgi:rod shape determining protein RodA
MLNFRLLKNSDYILWGGFFVILAISVLSIFSTTPAGSPLPIRHLSSIGLGLIFLLFGAYLDYRNWQKLAWILYGITLALLAVVIFAGFSSQGAQRWLSLGPISFQPSEISKIFLVITIANYLKDKKDKIKNVFDLVPFLALIAIPFLLIAKQPDLGTALVLIAIGLGCLIWAQSSPMVFAYLLTPILSIICRQNLILWIIYLLALFIVLYLCRVNWTEIIILLAVNVVVGVAWNFLWDMLHPYQKQRLLTFFNPSADPLGAGYHSTQSKIAVGSGFLFGKGFMHGTQTQLRFIPIQHADFVFSQIGEEFGFIGSLIVVSLLLLVVWRAGTIASLAADSFGGFLAAGIGFLFLFHTFVNIGMTLGSLPVVGIPLPLISFGGSSIITGCFAIGLLQSIYMRREKLFF